MKKILLLTAPAALFCWCLFSIQGCKRPVISDKDLLNQNDELNLAKDTLYAKVFSQFEQPLYSSSLTIGVLGSLADPNFGKTYAGFYAQCELSSNNVSFGTTPVLDSAVITLLYNGQYGKFDQPVTVVAYELSQDISDTLSYHTNDAFSVYPTPIGQVNNFVPNLTDSITVNGIIYPPHLRIPLTTAFANKILLTDTSNLVDNTAFLQLIKGIYVTTSSSTTGNGLLYINLITTLSSITLYYHDTGDTTSYQYSIPISGARINHFDNVYTSSPVASSINTPNPAGETKMFVQGGAGVKGKIYISNLDSLPKHISINKAELILTQSAPDTSYLAPLVLDLYRIDEAGNAQPLEDNSATWYGGVRTSEMVNGDSVTRYRFNIKKYFQKLIDGSYANNGFYLQNYSPNTNSERVVIANSSADEKYRVTLIVTYTKL